MKSSKLSTPLLLAVLLLSSACATQRRATYVQEKAGEAGASSVRGKGRAPRPARQWKDLGRRTAPHGVAAGTRMRYAERRVCPRERQGPPLRPRGHGGAVPPSSTSASKRARSSWGMRTPPPTHSKRPHSQDSRCLASVTCSGASGPVERASWSIPFTMGIGGQVGAPFA